MPEPTSSPFSRALSWLATHAGFPASRLPARAELLVLIAAAAEADTETPAAAGSPHRKVVGNPNFNAQLRHYTAQRRRAHINSDNSAKT